MYLHLGKSTVVKTDTIVGVFDIETTTISVRTRQYLAEAEKNGKIKNVSTELPKSFVVCNDGTVYISQLSPHTLFNRSENANESV